MPTCRQGLPQLLVAWTADPDRRPELTLGKAYGYAGAAEAAALWWRSIRPRVRLTGTERATTHGCGRLDLTQGKDQAYGESNNYWQQKLWT